MSIYNPITYKKIPLSKGEIALVDNEDYERVSQYKWSLITSKHKRAKYAMRYDENGEYCSMHRFIMNTPKGIEVDHHDGDGLNNQKYNLREASNGQNQRNVEKRRTHNGITPSSQYKGVTYRKTGRGIKRWRARIHLNNKSKYLGIFLTEIEAAKAYNEAAILYHGEFAKLNNI